MNIRDLRPVREGWVHHSIAQRVNLWLAGHRDVKITSSYRDVVRNERVGGVRNSRHLVGCAVDVVGPTHTINHLKGTARKHGAVEVIVEEDHLHVGWPRPKGTSTR